MGAGGGYQQQPGFANSYQALQGMGPYTQQPVNIPYQPVSSSVPSSLVPPGYFSALKPGGGVPPPGTNGYYGNQFLQNWRGGQLLPAFWGSSGYGYSPFFTGVGGTGHGGIGGGASGGGVAAGTGGGVGVGGGGATGGPAGAG
jgi:hypothetical protein